MNTYTKVLRYFNVGRLLHLIALTDLVISVVALYFIVTLDYSEQSGLVTIWIVVLLAFGGMSIYAELDGYSRFQDYKRVKDQLYFFGFQKRLLRTMERSRCQRDAAQLACNELAIGDESKAYFASAGYRWYHIIPEFVFDDPKFFFKAYFWSGTFFTPYYKPKVDYSQLDPGNLDLSMKKIQVESVI
jgi:hypothetical protein